MKTRSVTEFIRRFGSHDMDRPRGRRWGILPNRSHLRRGDRRKGHILRIHHHRGQEGG